MLHEHQTGFAPLNGHHYLALTTFQKDGQPVTTPIWFAQKGDTLYVMLPGNSDVLGRIHENAQVEVAPCDERGELLASSQTLEAMAVVLDASKATPARRACQGRGFQQRLHELLLMLRHTGRVYLEITPM